MFILLMWLMVQREQIDAFLIATLEMGQMALKENGTRRFEILRGDDDPTRFVLYKATNTRADHKAHLETPYAEQWLDTIAPMLAEPIQQSSYTQLF